MCGILLLPPLVEVVAVARTAVRGCDGELAGWHPVALAGVVGRAVLDRAGMSSAELDEVVVGCADPVGANGAERGACRGSGRGLAHADRRSGDRPRRD